MTSKEAVKILKQYNLARHGKMIGKPSSTKITLALEIAIKLLEKL